MSQSHFEFTIMGVKALETLEGPPLPPSVADLGCRAGGATVECQRHRGVGCFPSPQEEGSVPLPRNFFVFCIDNTIF